MPAIRRAVASRAGHVHIDPARRHRRCHRVTIAPGKHVVYPGTHSPAPTLVVIRKTSASVSDTDLQRYTSEVIGIAQGMGIRAPSSSSPTAPGDLRVMDVDAAFHITRDYTGGEGSRPGAGRGGKAPWPATKPPASLVICLVGPAPTHPLTAHRAGR